MKKIIYYLVSILIACSGAFVGLLMNVPLWKGAIISFAGCLVVVVVNATIESVNNILSKNI